MAAPAVAVPVTNPPADPLAAQAAIDDGLTEGEKIEGELFNVIPVGNNGWALYSAALVGKNLELADKSEVGDKQVIELVNRVIPAISTPEIKLLIQKNITNPEALTLSLDDPSVYKGFTSPEDYIAKLATYKVGGDFNQGPAAHPDVKLVASVLPNILEVTVVLFKKEEDNDYSVVKVFKKDNALGEIYLLYVNRDNVDILRQKSDEDIEKGPQKRSITEMLKAKKEKFKSALLKAKQGLKSAAASIGKKLKGLVGLSAGIIDIAGVETVNTTDSPTGHVEFIGNYVPEGEPEEAKVAIEVFNRIFGGKTYSESNPLLPPCVEQERVLLMDCLELRLNQLMGETSGKALEEGVTADVAAKTEALARLELLINQLKAHISGGKCRDYAKEGSPEEMLKIKTELDSNARLWLRKVLFSALQVYRPVPGYEHLNQDAKDTIAQLNKNPFTENDLGEYIKVWTEQQQYLGEGVPEILGRILDELDVQPGLLDIMLTDELKNMLQQLINWVAEDYATGFSDKPEKVQEFRDFSEGLKTSTLNIKQRVIELIRWITRKNIECWKELGKVQKELDDCKDLIEKQIAEIKDLDEKLADLQDREEKLIERLDAKVAELGEVNNRLADQIVLTKVADDASAKLRSDITEIRTLNASLQDQKMKAQADLALSSANEATLKRQVQEKDAAAAAALEAQNTAAAALQAAAAKKEGEQAAVNDQKAEIDRLTGELAAAQAKTAAATALGADQLKGLPPAKLLGAVRKATDIKGRAGTNPLSASLLGALKKQKGGGIEEELEASIAEQHRIQSQLQNAIQRYNELQLQNDDFRNSLKQSQEDMEKMRRISTNDVQKRAEAERQLKYLQNKQATTEEQAELKDEAQNEAIAELTGEVDGLEAKLEQKEMLTKLDDEKQTAEIAKLQTELGTASQRAAAAEALDAGQKAKIDELTQLAAKVAALSEEETAKKQKELDTLRAQIAELKTAQTTQKTATTNKDFYVKLVNYATNLFDNGNAADPSGIVKGSPAFMALYRKTHVLAKNPSTNSALCFLNLFVEGILKNMKFVGDTRAKIAALVEICIARLPEATKKDKLTQLLKVLLTLIDNYKGGTPLEDQTTYNAIFEENNKSPVVDVPSITEDKDKIFFDGSAPPALAATGLPFNVVFVMMLTAVQKYIEEHKAANKFPQAECDKISSNPVRYATAPSTN